MANILGKYRQCHKKLRTKLNPYTSRLCPVCPEPCCRKPTRVVEFDVLIANACGCDLPSAEGNVDEFMEAGFRILAGETQSETDLIPCDYLDEKGCLFPDDLRPFECARFICRFLKDEVTPGDMREIRDLLHKLGVAHRELRDKVMPK